jgi:hypothetical protein
LFLRQGFISSAKAGLELKILVPLLPKQLRLQAGIVIPTERRYLEIDVCRVINNPKKISLVHIKNRGLTVQMRCSPYNISGISGVCKGLYYPKEGPLRK